MSADPVSVQLDLLARLLEANGYALEVDYAGAAITVWTEAWPIQLRIARKEAVPINEAAEDEAGQDSEGCESVLNEGRRQGSKKE